MHQSRPWEELLLMLGALGAAIGLGKLLASNQILDWRTVLGRAVSTAGLSVGSGAVLLYFADPSPLALLGIGGLLASFGTSGIQNLVSRYRGNQK